MSAAFAFLDDIAVLAKAAMATLDDVAVNAAKASSKSAAVVVDDAAVTPQYVQGLSPKRELPIMMRIARASLLNKLVVIIPVIMLLNVFFPQAIPFLLIAGGSYLVFEGAEKVLSWLGVIKEHKSEDKVMSIAEDPKKVEDRIVRSASITDLVLSAEIMLISMASLGTMSWQMLLGTLVVIAIMMTAVVYGSVALLIKFDDMGLAIAKNKRFKKGVRGAGFAIAKNMLKVFNVIGVIGVIAMLWVGGHLLLVNVAELGFTAPLDFVTHIAHLATIPALTWLIDTVLSAIAGLIAGSVFTALFFAVKAVFPKKAHEDEEDVKSSQNAVEGGSESSSEEIEATMDLASVNDNDPQDWVTDEVATQIEAAASEEGTTFNSEEEAVAALRDNGTIPTINFTPKDDTNLNEKLEEWVAEYTILTGEEPQTIVEIPEISSPELRSKRDDGTVEEVGMAEIRAFAKHVINESKGIEKLQDAAANMTEQGVDEMLAIEAISELIESGEVVDVDGFLKLNKENSQLGEKNTSKNQKGESHA